ncbi:MAG: O-phosphoseryl-tRNA(Sec) selenium transferase|nr:O-phosphoseryl-tRNA(Sec) selenium transferase [Candidatus Lokiarchaeota archaeon]MBD3202060.1 O-phosphoseryl-tRNA(Sec) selenium transferase [Candidatus Lokiarchaeota archaeon]
MVDLSKLTKYFENSKIPDNMLHRGQLVLNEFLKPIKNLFEQKAVPHEGWNDEQILYLLDTLANMDTDKDEKASRVGEREARIASGLHLRISGGFCHGVGRSGFLTAPQPKAPGGSIMYEITNYLARDIMRKSGLPNIKAAIISPVATGMSLALTLSAFKTEFNETSKSHQNSILLPRLDHNSILKALDFLGLDKCIVDGEVYGDAVRINLEDIKKKYKGDCFAIVSFTSFFPPREHDDIKGISKFAKEKDLVHIVVNAYGVQSPEWMKMIRSAIDAGRVDAIIQSTDKNFLTPVGGALIASPNKKKIEKISRTYPGRASATPVINFLISMLSLGVDGYEKLIKQQQENRKLLERLLRDVATKINERVMDIFNPVAVALTLNNLKEEQLYALGGALYNLRVTGPRVYNPNQKRFGTCSENYETPYIVMNAAIGATREDITRAVERFEQAYSDIK